MPKIFYLNGDKDKPIKAGGVIIYRKINNCIELLLINKCGLYEDIGGRIENFDDDICDMVKREVKEETNDQIIFDKNRLISAPFIYSEKCKYILFITMATHNEAILEKSHFGDKEFFDDIIRTINWIPLKTFMDPIVIKHKLNFRIKNKSLFSKLKEINDHKIKAIRLI